MVRNDFLSCSELLASSRIRLDGTCRVIPLFVFRGFESSMLLLFDFVSISSKLLRILRVARYSRFCCLCTRW